jgi:hypothetical protein
MIEVRRRLDKRYTTRIVQALIDKALLEETPLRLVLDDHTQFELTRADIARAESIAVLDNDMSPDTDPPTLQGVS